MAHLESTLPDGISIAAAREAGYHLDHIIPRALISKALPDDEDGRELAFRMAQDLANLRMIPGVENISKNDKFPLNPEQEEVFFYLCKKYGVIDELLNTVFPY